MAEPTSRACGGSGQPEKLIDATGKERQTQAFEPSDAVAIAVPVGKAILILALLALGVKVRLELLKCGIWQDDFEGNERQAASNCLREDSRIIEHNPKNASPPLNRSKSSRGRTPGASGLKPKTARSPSNETPAWPACNRQSSVDGPAPRPRRSSSTACLNAFAIRPKRSPRNAMTLMVRHVGAVMLMDRSSLERACRCTHYDIGGDHWRPRAINAADWRCRVKCSPNRSTSWRPYGTMKHG
jgi:hypothetical protein